MKRVSTLGTPLGHGLPAVLLCAALCLVSCSESPKTASTEENDASTYRISSADQKKVDALFPGQTPSASGLISILRQAGTGPKPKYGSLVTLHYELRLLDGTLIESSRTKNDPLLTPIGIGRVIKAWDESVLTMQIGERRTLVVPHYLGYGVTGNPPKIPPYSTLVFDIELLSIK